MMGGLRFHCVFASFAFVIGSALAASPDDRAKPELVIYTYDSLIAKGGLGPAIFPLFEKKYGCRVRALSAGDGVQILTRLQIDAQRGKKAAHLILGIDQHIWERAKPWLENWGRWEPQGYSNLIPESRIEKGFLPVDYGVFSLIGDRALLAKMKRTAPRSVSDLLKPEWKRNIILEDPRTSTPGLAFLLFTQKVLGQKVWDFWGLFRHQWLTLAPGWNEAYGLFLRKEAPLVWSYVTSQAYHEEHGDQLEGQRRYEALLFQEGQPYQIEGAAWVKGAIQSDQERKLAQNFMEFLISPEVQSIVMRTSWMMPVLKSVKLPKSYQNLPKPTRLIQTAFQVKEQESTLAHWGRVIH
jgi:thiamine transport system substrate-binding protein